MKNRITLKLIIVLLGVIVALGISPLFLSAADKSTQASITYKGFRVEGENIYYYDDNGEKVSGWNKIKGDTFYFDEDTNAMVTGKQEIDGKSYTFKENGKLKIDTAQAKMDAKAESLSSDTKYLILANCKTHKVGIYEGSKGNWTRLYYWTFSDGRPGHETPRGVYRMGTERTNQYHFRYFDSEGGRLWYATKIWDAYLFHSIPYEIESEPNTIQDPRLGQSVSKGCLRLSVENAKWIYENIPTTTYCEIYDE